MPDSVIPPEVKVAAKRAFIRTTAQGYATSISASLILAAVSLIQDGTNWLAVVVAVVTAIVTPLAAGAAAYWSWLAKGIPDDYAAATPTEKIPDTALDDPALLQRAWQAQVAKNQATIDGGNADA